MVFYRKYRPQTINELDSTAVREALQSILQKNVPHAFLFTGPKGLGKTSTARIIAKVVNCEEKGEGREERGKVQVKKDKLHPLPLTLNSSVEPCNVCEQCVSITNGTNMDVLEIDAASNRGIDEIRDLKEKIRLMPLTARMKVYIIDEVHMLTTEAFNALLKTLEEPPAHAMFVLATTEPHKVPSTILSRCLHINFNRATVDEIVRSLERVIAGEKINIEKDALYSIADVAQRSDNGFRDAVKLLEEVASLARGEKITKEWFEKSHSNANVSLHIEELLAAMKNHDVKAGLETVKTVVSQGVDIKFFIAQILADLHANLLMQVGIKNQEARIKDTKFTLEEIKQLVELFSKAHSEMKYAVIPQLPLELAIIEWCGKVATKSTPSSPLKVEDRGEIKKAESLPPVMKTDEGVTVSSLRKQVGDLNKNIALYGEVQDKNALPDAPTVEATTLELLHAFPDGEVTKEWLELFWKSLLSEMKNYNHTMAGVLRSCTIKSFSKNSLIIEAAYPFHQERLNERKTLDALTKICKLLTGKEMQVEVELKK